MTFWSFRSFDSFNVQADLKVRLYDREIQRTFGAAFGAERFDRSRTAGTIRNVSNDPNDPNDSNDSNDPNDPNDTCRVVRYV